MPEIVEKGWEVQRRIEERLKRMGKGKYGRILKMARKPTSDEFSTVLIITGLGLLAVGALGFVIYFVMRYGGSFFTSLFGMI
jgi:protein transport protein SEC61 subunit gamma-like protein